MKAKQGYLTNVKQNNMATVLRQIWEAEPISRIELVDRTELTSGTMTNLTQELLKAGLIRESESAAGVVGRKRILLRLDSELYRLIGIDIGRNAFEIVLSDLRGRVIASSEASTVGMDDPGRILDLVTPYVLKMRAAAQEQGHRLLGIGVSIPGPMDLQRGLLLDPPNFPGWANYPIRGQMEKRLSTPVIVNDDARTSALAERWFGLGRKSGHLVHITMGMGIGGGVVMNGEIINGANGLYGQIGHMTVAPGGERCACGNVGCWETVGSIPGILRQWTGGRRGTIAGFFEAVHREEPDAVRVLNAVLSAMADALTTLFNVYDPELIVLSGKLYPYLAQHIPEIRQLVQSRVYPFVRDRVRIEPSTFGTSQSAVGAAALVFERLMKEPFNALEGQI